MAVWDSSMNGPGGGVAARLAGLSRAWATVPRSRTGSKWNAVQQGNAAAEKERRRLDLGIAPLPDVANLLGAQGISTFSFAHEYAHVLLDRELKAILSHARDRSSLMEVRANAFAASFLMPAEGVRGYVNALSKGLGSRTRADTFDEEAVTRVEGRKRVDTQNIELHDVVRMAHHFGVSCTAMLYRLKGLDFVTEDERSSLAAQDSAGLAKALRGFLGLPEPVDSDGEMRVHARFVAMAIEAFTRGKITQRKLDELGSLVQVSDLSQRLRQAGFGDGLWPWLTHSNENLIGRAGTATPEELAVFAEHRKVMGLGEAACLAVDPVAGSEDRGDQPRRTARREGEAGTQPVPDAPGPGTACAMPR